MAELLASWQPNLHLMRPYAGCEPREDCCHLHAVAVRAHAIDGIDELAAPLQCTTCSSLRPHQTSPASPLANQVCLCRDLVFIQNARANRLRATDLHQESWETRDILSTHRARGRRWQIEQQTAISISGAS